jgi:Right handed beta helix region
MQAQRSLRAVIATAAAGFLGIAVAGCTGSSPHPQASMAIVPSTGASAASSGAASAGSSPGAAAAPSSGAVSCPAAGATAVSSASALSGALSTARPGEVIVLAAGVYNGDFVAAVSGTAGAPITLCGSRNAILQGDSTSSGYAFYLNHASWWRVEGFTVEGGQKGIMADGADHNLLNGLYVHGTGDEAIHLRSFSSDNTISHNVIRDTGSLKSFYGEGIYVGSAHSNWCQYSQCQPDGSDGNVLIDNNIMDTTAENIDVKEGTTGGKIIGNQFNGTGMVESAATGWINVKGNDWTVQDNAGTDSDKNGYQVHQVYPGWGIGNVFIGNRAQVNGPGYGIYVQNKRLQTVVACNNVVTAAGSGFSTVACSSA